jgi:hypothetical protein
MSGFDRLILAFPLNSLINGGLKRNKSQKNGEDDDDGFHGLIILELRGSK